MKDPQKYLDDLNNNTTLDQGTPKAKPHNHPDPTALYVTHEFGYLELSGWIISDWEGDPSIPNGCRRYQYIDDLTILNGAEKDITDLFTPQAIETFENILLTKGV